MALVGAIEDGAGRRRRSTIDRFFFDWRGGAARPVAGRRAYDGEAFADVPRR